MDHQEIREVYEEWFRPLMHFAVVITGSEDLAYEAVQNVFAELLEKPRDIQNFKPYLFQAVKNRAIKELKSRKLHLDLESALELEGESDPERHLIEEEQLAAVLEIIRSMPPRRRSIFLLSREAGLKYREIAELLEISVKTVENQMIAALKSLKKKSKLNRGI